MDDLCFVMTSVDIDLGSYKLYIDGVQVNKTPQVVKPRETNKKSKHPVILKIIVGPNCNSNCKYCCQIGKNKSEPLKIEELLDNISKLKDFIGNSNEKKEDRKSVV